MQVSVKVAKLIVAFLLHFQSPAGSPEQGALLLACCLAVGLAMAVWTAAYQSLLGKACVL